MGTLFGCELDPNTCGAARGDNTTGYFNLCEGGEFKGSSGDCGPASVGPEGGTVVLSNKVGATCSISMNCVVDGGIVEETLTLRIDNECGYLEVEQD